MFENVGSKIKGIAQAFTWIGIILFIILGCTVIALSESLALLGLIVMILGSVISWMSSLVLYRFGQLVENSEHWRSGTPTESSKNSAEELHLTTPKKDPAEETPLQTLFKMGKN